MLTKPRNRANALRNTLSSRRKRRFSPLMLIGTAITILVALIGVGVFVIPPHLASNAATTVNMNCTLIIPNNPLTAQGLATPYQLTATSAANGACNEANANQSAFVQADILDPATGQIQAYEPLVIDQGSQPAVTPTAPTLPANAVVGIWFGFNGNILTLQKNAQAGGNGTGGRVQSMLTMQGGTNGNCVNGVANSPFGQFGYCNAVNFFSAANQAIQTGKIQVPALGTAKDGEACLTTRSFALVDMDQSDNVQTQYLANGNGQTAQFSAANQAAIQNATTISNPSDNALLTRFVDPALGCTPWTVTDLVNTGTPTATYGTDELMAAADQQSPIALVPGGDPMVLNNNNQDLNKVNAYRVGADQTQAASLTGNAATDANTTTYCQNLVNVALPRLKLDMTLFQNQASPDNGATATTLFGFLANRLNNTFSANGLNCVGLLNIQNPITLTTNGNGVVTSATINTTPTAATATATATTTASTATTNSTTNTVTGTVTATLNTNAGTAQVTQNLTIANFANQQYTLNITDSSTGKQLLQQAENTDANGANNATTTINNLQGTTTIPNTWVVSITTNGTTLASATMSSNGTTATATFTATSTTTTTSTTATATAAATTGTTTTTSTTTTSATPTATATTTTATATTTTTTTSSGTTTNTNHNNGTGRPHHF